jgi:hypothetical protein
MSSFYFILSNMSYKQTNKYKHYRASNVTLDRQPSPIPSVGTPPFEDAGSLFTFAADLQYRHHISRRYCVWDVPVNTFVKTVQSTHTRERTAGEAFSFTLRKSEARGGVKRKIVGG